ncbi:MAG: PEGA domain-containing protein [Desulfobacteraceae bacterium]|nr:MAG: PEGA domain-containing protein [Desulfobacteraceae bacterium]
MKLKYDLMIFFVFVYVSLTMYPASVFAELIEPTRTLKSQEEPMGRLSVFSEPPELDVVLDGTKIGKTPVISMEVRAGDHVLRIKDTKKEIFILPDESLQLSLYKDSLIEIPEKKLEPPRLPKLEEKRTTEAKKQKGSDEEEIQYRPFYWPVNPRGPIY